MPIYTDTTNLLHQARLAVAQHLYSSKGLFIDCNTNIFHFKFKNYIYFDNIGIYFCKHVCVCFYDRYYSKIFNVGANYTE